MTLRECRCPEPNPFPAPHKRHVCVNCRRNISTAWTSNDATVAAFFDRLAATFPTLPPAFESFRELVEARERAGRDTFRHRSLGRNNCEDGAEEAADGSLYAFLDTLQAVRLGLGDEDIDLALTAARKFYEGYEALMHLREKRLGAP